MATSVAMGKHSTIPIKQDKKVKADSKSRKFSVKNSISTQKINNFVLKQN